MATTSSSLTSRELTQSLDIIEVKPGLRFSLGILKQILPDIETALFFGKVYGLDAAQLGSLLAKVLKSDLAQALFGEGNAHSSELQDYLVSIIDEADLHDSGEIITDPDIKHGEILPQVWESLELEVAASIKAVADKLGSVVDKLPGKNGQMIFRTMLQMNRQRPSLGVHKAMITHPPHAPNLLILDVSASMSAGTVRRIIDDVIALSYKADAHMAVVSNTTTHWEPGTYDADTVLRKSEFGGTHYETLEHLLNRDWGTVITVADYDSSLLAKQRLAKCTGRIEKVLDLSLVNRPTFLAECVGQHAAAVQPLLIASTHQVLAD